MTGIEVVAHRNGTVRHLWVVFHAATPVAFCPTALKAEAVADALAMRSLLAGHDPVMFRGRPIHAVATTHVEGPAPINLVGTVWLVVHDEDVIAFCPTDAKAHDVAEALTLYGDVGAVAA